LRIMTDRRYRVRHDCPTHSPYVDNLHACMNDFLDHRYEDGSHDDYWMSMDDDNPPHFGPNHHPLDLIKYDCDIIGLPTPVWHSAVPGDRPYYYNALYAVDGGWQPVSHIPTYDEPIEVDAIGTGCFIIARRVMEAMRHEMPFARTWNESTGRVEIGNDYSFCKRAKQKGFRIWAHFGYTCEHFNELPLTEVIQRFNQMRM